MDVMKCSNKVRTFCNVIIPYLLRNQKRFLSHFTPIYNTMKNRNRLFKLQKNYIQIKRNFQNNNYGQIQHSNRVRFQLLLCPIAGQYLIPLGPAAHAKLGRIAQLGRREVEVLLPDPRGGLDIKPNRARAETWTKFGLVMVGTFCSYTSM